MPRPTPASDHLHPLDHAARVSLFLASLATRPLPPTFDEVDAPALRFGRAQLFALAKGSGIGIGCHAFYSTLDDVAATVADDLDVPVVRLIRHARRVEVDLMLADIDEETDEAWETLVSDALTFDDLDEEDDEDEDADSDLRDALSAYGFDVASPLPETISPSLRASTPPSRRCLGACGEVKPCEAFGLSGDRLLSRCRECRAEESREWRRANPEKANRPRPRPAHHYAPRSRTGRPYGPRPRGFVL